MSSQDSLFPRSFKARYPVAARGEGVYLYDDQGKRYLDACGGAAVVTIGHGVREVAEQIAEMTSRLPYVHSSQFQTQAAAELAGLLATGCRPPALSQGKSPEEDEKRLSTVLFAGDPVIHIDNCEHAGCVLSDLSQLVRVSSLRSTPR